MTQGAHPITNTEATPANPAGVGATPAAPEAVPQQASPAPVAAPAAAQAPVAAQPERRRLSADTDEIPNDAEVLELSPSAFKKRLERANRSQLKQAFGTDNVEDILAWKQQAEQYKAEREAAELAAMTEAERFKVQFEKAQSESQHWRSQYETLQESYAVRDQDRQVTNVVNKYVHPKLQNAVIVEFATHIQSMDESEIGDSMEYAEAWFKNYVEQNPEFGVPGARPAAADPANPFMPQQQQPPQMQPRQVPITNGAQGGRPAVAPVATEKTLAPGQPNSMTPSEAKAWMRANGYNF